VKTTWLKFIKSARTWQAIPTAVATISVGVTALLALKNHELKKEISRYETIQMKVELRRQEDEILKRLIPLIPQYVERKKSGNQCDPEFLSMKAEIKLLAEQLEGIEDMLAAEENAEPKIKVPLDKDLENGIVIQLFPPGPVPWVRITAGGKSVTTTSKDK